MTFATSRFKDSENFNKDIHTLEFFADQWGIDGRYLLFKRLSLLSDNDKCIALWAHCYTCSACCDEHIPCHCENDE